MKTLCVFLLVTMSGCASISGKIDSDIKIGDTGDRVKEVLGNPATVQPSIMVDGGEDWIYRSKKDECTITLSVYSVKYYSCNNNPNYVNPASAIFKGMGNGLSHAQDNRTNCYSSPDGAGGFITNCH